MRSSKRDFGGFPQMTKPTREIMQQRNKDGVFGSLHECNAFQQRIVSSLVPHGFSSTDIELHGRNTLR